MGGVIDATRPLLRWVSAHDMPSEVLVACADAEVPRTSPGTLVVEVPGCLGSTSISLPAQLLALGVPRISVLECAEPGARSLAEVASWERALRDVGPWSAPAGSLSWRGFWLRARRRRALVLRLGQIPIPRRTLLGIGLRDRLPVDLALDEEARTIAALRLLAQQGRADLAATRADRGDDSAAGPALRLSAQACVACGVCARACPNDALVMGGEGTSSTLTHLRDRCRGAMECVELCPSKAIVVTGHLPLADVVREPSALLARVETAECDRCGTRHPASEGRLCRTCRYRSVHAFGSALSPGTIREMARRGSGGRRTTRGDVRPIRDVKEQ